MAFDGRLQPRVTELAVRTEAYLDAAETLPLHTRLLRESYKEDEVVKPERLEQNKNSVYKANPETVRGIETHNFPGNISYLLLEAVFRRSR